MSIPLAMAKGALKICEQVALQRIDGLKEELQQAKTIIEWQKETIKGLDRATVEYTRIIAEKDKRIADLLEADAGRPVRDINGTIEAQANRIANQEAVIKQYQTEMQALQRKVQEQDERLANDKEECAEALRIHRALDGCNGQSPRRMDGTVITQSKEQS